MKLFKLMAILILATVLTGCSDEPENDANMPIYRRMMQSMTFYDDKYQLPPADDKPQYYIINSAREIASLPVGTISPHAVVEYSSVDFAKYTLIVVTSVVYGVHVENPEEDFVFSMADYELTRDYQLNITYSYCTLTPTWNFPDKYIMQFAFTTSKIASNTPLTLVESLKPGN